MQRTPLRLPAVGAALVLCGLAFCPPVAAHDPDVAELSARIAAAPHDASLLLERSDLYYRSGRHRDALSDLALAEGLRPGERRIWLQRAMSLHALGRDRDAAAALDAFLGSGPGDVRAHVLRAELLIEGGRFDEALADYHAAITLDDQVAIYLDRARLQQRLGRLDDAAQDLRAGIQALGGAALLRMELVRVERARHRPLAALAELERLTAGARATAQLSLLRAEILDDLRRPDDARAAREHALSEADRILQYRLSAGAMLARGEALIGLGRPTEATADLERALALSPQLTRARTLLARLRGPARGERR